MYRIMMRKFNGEKRVFDTGYKTYEEAMVQCEALDYEWISCDGRWELYIEKIDNSPEYSVDEDYDIDQEIFRALEEGYETSVRAREM